MNSSQTDNSNTDLQTGTAKKIPPMFYWIGIILSVYALLLAVGMIGGGFKWATGGSNGVKKLFAFATNPFMGLILGTMATALVQSSSTVSSVIVALCAGGMPVHIAVPMIMGANIGTTVTNTLVSLGHIGDKEEFKRAFSAATVHDFFNVLSVAIFLPLEMLFHPLEKLGFLITDLFIGGKSVSMGGLNFLKGITKPVVGVTKSILNTAMSHPFGAILLIIIGLGFIFLSIFFIGKILKKVLIGKAENMFQTAIGRGPISGIASGTIVTVLVQSSSTTTSLVVPLAGSGIISINKVYPFALGANIGTCITAILASTAITGNGSFFALQIALVHFLYNLIGVIVIYGVPFTRNLPVKWAEWLANLASERKVYALLYIATVFFIVPGIFLGLYYIL